MSYGAILKQRHEHKQKDNFSSVIYNQMYRQKGDFIRFVCVRIAAAVDKINKMADCPLPRLKGKQGKFFASFFE